MEIQSYAPGTPCWIDLGIPDPDGAAAFYGALFGWACEEGPPEAGGYRMCMLRGRAVAGLGPQMNPDVPPFWSTYIAVADTDATAALVGELGGQVIVAPMDVMTAGRMAVCTEPAGAAFSLWQAGTTVGAGLANEPGAFAWNELMTDDVEGAKAFYGALFGWEAETVAGAMPYTEFKLDGRPIAGMMPKPPTMPPEAPPTWGVYFAVDDADAAVATITGSGGSVMMGPTDIEPGRFAVVADPYGAFFMVMKLKEGLGA
ncbi:MAG TPA: VOC family protein [Acidimicrobiales bacterium]